MYWTLAWRCSGENASLFRALPLYSCYDAPSPFTDARSPCQFNCGPFFVNHHSLQLVSSLFTNIQWLAFSTVSWRNELKVDTLVATLCQANGVIGSGVGLAGPVSGWVGKFDQQLVMCGSTSNSFSTSIPEIKENSPTGHTLCAGVHSAFCWHAKQPRNEKQPSPSLPSSSSPRLSSDAVYRQRQVIGRSSLQQQQPHDRWSEHGDV